MKVPRDFPFSGKKGKIMIFQIRILFSEKREGLFKYGSLIVKCSLFGRNQARIQDFFPWFFAWWGLPLESFKEKKNIFCNALVRSWVNRLWTRKWYSIFLSPSHDRPCNPLFSLNCNMITLDLAITNYGFFFEVNFLIASAETTRDVPAPLVMYPHLLWCTRTSRDVPAPLMMYPHLSWCTRTSRDVPAPLMMYPHISWCTRTSRDVPAPSVMYPHHLLTSLKINS